MVIQKEPRNELTAIRDKICGNSEVNTSSLKTGKGHSCLHFVDQRYYAKFHFENCSQVGQNH